MWRPTSVYLNTQRCMLVCSYGSYTQQVITLTKERNMQQQLHNLPSTSHKDPLQFSHEDDWKPREEQQQHVHLSPYLHTRNFHGYFEVWTPCSSSRFVTFYSPPSVTTAFYYIYFFNPRRASSQGNKLLERKISKEVWLRSGGTVSERNGGLTCRRLKWTNYKHTVTKWAQKKKCTERMTRSFLPPSREERRCVNVSFAHTSTATCCS